MTIHISNCTATGSCNCGKVTFSVTTPLTDIYMCHCSICRKSTGGTGIAVVVVPNDSVVWQSGQDCIQTWEKPNHDWLKTFCSHCGSPLPAENSADTVFIPVGLLDTGTENLSVKHHIWVDSKAKWEQIGDNGRQHKQAFQG